VGIQRGERLEATEGGKNQGLKTLTQGVVAVLEQGKVVTGMGVLMRFDGLLELCHHRVTCSLVIEPMGKAMDAHRGQTGPHLDDLCTGGRRPEAWGVARSAFRPIELPLVPHAIEMANAEVKGCLSLGDLVEHKPTGALWVFMKQGPQPSLLDVTKLSTGTKGWTCRGIYLPLSRGE